MERRVDLKSVIGLIVIAVTCGVLFQFVQIVVFDSTGLNRVLGELVIPSAIVIPVFVSALISYLYYRNKAWTAATGMLTLIIAGLAINFYLVGPGVPPEPYTLPAYVENVSLWDHGKFTPLNTSKGLVGYLLYTVQKLNLQADCAFFEDEIVLLKQNDKVVELTFGKPVNITVDRPEERNNVSEYRMLTNVESIIFVLDGDLKGYILIKSAGTKYYCCWAIQRNRKIDESWINEVENAIKGLNYKVEECSVGFEPEKIVEYDGRTLVAYVTVNCCGVDIAVEKEGNVYKIVEKQYGELCRCMCTRKVTIYDVPIGAKVVFINKDGVSRILTPYVNTAGFCGWSTYGKCSSDYDCVTGGCSGQVCQSKFEEPVGTTCEWFECYDADKYGVACRCVDGKCQWVGK